jgi:signal transduction histidine kinase
MTPEVPLWALGDYSRIRQGNHASLAQVDLTYIRSVLMNLLGNALKFTENGSVSTICSVDRTIPCAENEVVLKWAVQCVKLYYLFFLP